MKNGLLTMMFFFSCLIALGQTSVYIRGTGYNYSGARVVKLNGQSLNVPPGRGLCLTVINANNHQQISSVTYDTHGSTIASDNLAVALNDLRRGEIGILTSNDAWEYNVSPNLQNAARRLGLYKLSGAPSTGIRRPYAAIFRGSGTSTGNTQPNHIAYEVMQSDAADSEWAVIATWLIDDAFIGNNLSNALVYGDGAMTGSALFVNRLGNVGIGTYAPAYKLEVNGTIKTKEIIVTASDWADYVFQAEYQVMPLSKLESFIQSKGHLPNIPTEKEVLENGVNLVEMNMKLLEKIEELTLYIIVQEKRIKALEEK